MLFGEIYSYYIHWGAADNEFHQNFLVFFVHKSAALNNESEKRTMSSVLAASAVVQSSGE